MSARTLQLGLAILASNDGTDWSMVMTGAVISTLPLIALFVLLTTYSLTYLQDSSSAGSQVGLTAVLIASAVGLISTPAWAMLSDRVGVMSSRPGLFIDIVETGWERERDSRIVSTPRFGEVNARLWEKLRVESLKVMGIADGR